MSVEGPGRLFAREHRAGFLPRFFGRHRCAHVVVLKDNEEGYLGQSLVQLHRRWWLLKAPPKGRGYMVLLTESL